MIIRKIIVFFLILFLNIHVFSQKIVEPSPIRWYTIEQADSLFEKNPKPMLIDVYTDWCGWCKYMMKTTFASKGIASYINMNFYPIRFNAETLDTLRYNGKTYTNPGVGVKSKHDLAKYLLKGKFAFPTIVYVDRKRNLFQIPGYTGVKDIEPLLVYFAEELNFNCSYDSWKELFQYNYPKVYEEDIAKTNPASIPDTGGVVNYKKIGEASGLCLENKKPLLIYFYTDWCKSCKIEEGVVFKNKIIADLLNEKFNFVMFNAASTETIRLFGGVLKSTGQGNPHQLTYALLKQSFKFPAFVFINSERQKLNEIHGFLLPYQLEEMLVYFGTGKYKTQTNTEFLKTYHSLIKTSSSILQEK